MQIALMRPLECTFNLDGKIIVLLWAYSIQCLKSSDVCKFSVFVRSALGASNCWTGIWNEQWNGMKWWIYTVAAIKLV